MLLFLIKYIVLIRTKSWQQTQTTQYPRGLGSAAASPYYTGGGSSRIIYSMGKSRDWMYSTVETIGQFNAGYKQLGAGQSTISKS
jgi:hypothetical protein